MGGGGDGRQWRGNCLGGLGLRGRLDSAPFAHGGPTSNGGIRPPATVGPGSAKPEPRGVPDGVEIAGVPSAVHARMATPAHALTFPWVQGKAAESPDSTKKDEHFHQIGDGKV